MKIGTIVQKGSTFLIINNFPFIFVGSRSGEEDSSQYPCGVFVSMRPPLSAPYRGKDRIISNTWIELGKFTAPRCAYYELNKLINRLLNEQ